MKYRGKVDTSVIVLSSRPSIGYYMDNCIKAFMHCLQSNINNSHEGAKIDVQD